MTAVVTTPPGAFIPGVSTWCERSHAARLIDASGVRSVARPWAVRDAYLEFLAGALKVGGVSEHRDVREVQGARHGGPVRPTSPSSEYGLPSAALVG
jgi:hypothetical protein